MTESPGMIITIELDPATTREVLEYITDFLMKCQPYVRSVMVSEGKRYA